MPFSSGCYLQSESQACCTTLIISSPLLLFLPRRWAGKESAELEDWHSCFSNFTFLMLWFHTSVSQHFLIVSYKVLQLSLSNLSTFSQTPGDLIGVIPRHSFHSPPLLFLFIQRQGSVLIHSGFQELLLLFKDNISKFGINQDPSVFGFNYRNGN